MFGGFFANIQSTELQDLFVNLFAPDIYISVRKGDVNWNSPIMNLRRSSDEFEKEFYFDSNNTISLSSEDGYGTSLSEWAGSDSVYIQTWYDQSGNGRDFTQNSSTNQPMIINAGTLITENGKTAVSFNKKFLFGASAASYTDFSIYGVTTSNDTKTLNNTWVSGGNSANGFFLFNQLTSGYGLSRLRVGSTNYDSNYNVDLSLNQGVFVAQSTSEQLQMFFNDDAGTTSTTYPTIGFAGTSILLGANSILPTSLYLIGTIQEFVMFTTDVSSSRTVIQNNQNSYYSVY
jgi:hypothetical protein